MHVAVIKLMHDGHAHANRFRGMAIYAVEESKGSEGSEAEPKKMDTLTFFA